VRSRRRAGFLTLLALVYTTLPWYFAVSRSVSVAKKSLCAAV
jgi:hypothetical protein